MKRKLFLTMFGAFLLSGCTADLNKTLSALGLDLEPKAYSGAQICKEFRANGAKAIKDYKDKYAVFKGKITKITNHGYRALNSNNDYISMIIELKGATVLAGMRDGYNVDKFKTGQVVEIKGKIRTLNDVATRTCNIDLEDSYI